MSNRLLKFARRKAAWVDAAQNRLSIEELQKREFKHRDGGPDLRASVYAVEPDHSTAVKAYAEHSAAAPIDPPSATIGVDAVGLSTELCETPGNPKFTFIRDRHRELVINSVAELYTLIENILSEFEKRQEPVTRAEVIKYAQTQVAAGDREWIEATLSTDADEKEWLRSLRQSKNQ